MTGYIVKIGDLLVSWKLKKQNTISRSSAEAEYRALAIITPKITWVIRLMFDLGIQRTRPVDIYYDSKAAIHIMTNSVFHKQTKHIEIDCHFIREKLQQKLIKLHHARSYDQQAV